eukprot:scaffold179_cov373-Pavlova_lutheri.AAC.2
MKSACRKRAHRFLSSTGVYVLGAESFDATYGNRESRPSGSMAPRFANPRRPPTHTGASDPMECFSFLALLGANASVHERSVDHSQV